MPAPTCPKCGSSCFEQLDDDSYICCTCNSIIPARRLEQRRLLAEIVEAIESGKEPEPCEGCGVRPIFAFARRW